MRILLADDDSVTRTLLSAALRHAGHEPVLARDGQEAWERLQAEPFSLVVVDWMMPRMDGPELIRRIREAAFPSYVYTILLTSRQGQDDRVDGLEAGADDYLTKPVDLRELRARLAVASRIVSLEARLREMNAQLAHQATHDELTGLLNRAAIVTYARSELARSIRSGQPLCLALLDIDHFKAINDRYGHQIGDLALQQVARRIQASVRTYDWASRWGGEEFLLVLPGTNGPTALAVAERVRANVAAAGLALAAGLAAPLTLSGGVACSAGRPEVSSDQLFGEADAALYRAKAGGRNQVCGP